MSESRNLMRTTARSGKGTAKHSFREFSPNSENIRSKINHELSYLNCYYINHNFYTDKELKELYSQQEKFFYALDKKYQGNEKYRSLSKTQKIELSYYERALQNHIEEQNVRNAARRQTCRNKTALDFYKSKKTEPEEMIFQVGNMHNHISGSMLWEIYQDYQTRHNQLYGKHIIILDAALQLDESTPHIHERRMYLGTNDYGETIIHKNSALEHLGFHAPEPDKPVDRWNNPKQSYSAACRSLWISVCKEHGLNINEIPEPRKDKRGLDLLEYKARQEEKKLHDFQVQVSQMRKLKSDLSIDCDSIRTEKDNLQSEISNLQIDKNQLQSDCAAMKQQLSTGAELCQDMQEYFSYDNWMAEQARLYGFELPDNTKSYIRYMDSPDGQTYQDLREYEQDFNNCMDDISL